MRRLIFFILIIFIFVLNGCSNALDKASIDVSDDVTKTNYYDVKGSENKSIEIKKTFKDSVLTFTYESSSKVLQNENNMFSPISFYMALAMLAEVADGNTRNEILSALKINDINSLRSGIYFLYNKMCFENQIGKLSFGNSIWLKKDYNFNLEIIKTLAEKYYSSSYAVNFDDETKSLMSEWVKKNTGGKLGGNDFNDLSSNTIAVLLNTIYFYDEWITSFEKNNNQIDSFYSGGKVFETEYMKTIKQAGYYRGLNFTSTSMSFKNNSKMIFVLPDEGVEVESIIRNPEILRNSISSINNRNAEIHFKIPKFNFKSEYDLIPIADSLGIKEAFTSNSNFSTFTDKELFISNITQKSSVSIDEKGCEATAFTKIYLYTSMPSSEPLYFTLNRPFIFAIVSDDYPLFIGVVNNPIQA